jgi:hypothetical protein
MTLENIHQAAIEKFLERVELEYKIAIFALGDPPDLRVEIEAHEVTKLRQTLLRGRLKIGEIEYVDCLVIRVPTKAHAYALWVGHDVFFEAALGLFTCLRVESADGGFKFRSLFLIPPDSDEPDEPMCD